MRYFLLGIAIVVPAVAYEVMVWNECLSDHSVWYCLWVLG